MFKRLVLAPIGWYRKYISPAIAPRCRYYPSCSTYAVEAIEVHGVFKGLALSAWRILRCNPYSRGGVDHVPEVGHWRYAYPKDVARFQVPSAAGGQDAPQTRQGQLG